MASDSDDEAAQQAVQQTEQPPREEEAEEPLEALEAQAAAELASDEEAVKDASSGKSDAAVEQMCAAAMRAAAEAIANLREIDARYAAERSDAEAALSEREAAVESQRTALADLVASLAKTAVDAHGRPLAASALAEREHRARALESELETERKKASKLRASLRALETAAKRREEARDGLHVIDFEQLKIENQTYAEKIEARNEELAKLRRKIDSTVQVLTHVKEKLLFVHGETDAMQEELTSVEARVLQARDTLAGAKQERDSLRAANVRLQQQNGLVGSAELLQDYEANRAALEEARERLEHLRRLHAVLVARTQQTPGSAAASSVPTTPPATADSSSVKLPAIVTSTPPSSRR